MQSDTRSELGKEFISPFILACLCRGEPGHHRKQQRDRKFHLSTATRDRTKRNFDYWSTVEEGKAFSAVP